MYIYLNDRLVPKAEAVVSVFDHGFLYGDGIYETVRAYDGVIFKLDEHIERLFRSASLIGLAARLDLDGIKAAIHDTLRANSLRDAYVRMTISRGYGPIGLDPELCKKPTLVIIAEEMRVYPESFYESGIDAIICRTKRNLKEAVDPQIKSLNFLNNILAKIEAKKEGAFEALMLNVSGFITEGTISNIFFYKEGVLCTPSPDCGILDGITRKVILDIALKEGLHVKEGEFTSADIYAASEVFITNTTAEVLPVRRVDNVRYKAGDVGKLLRKAYRDEVAAFIRGSS